MSLYSTVRYAIQIRRFVGVYECARFLRHAGICAEQRRLILASIR